MTNTGGSELIIVPQFKGAQCSFVEKLEIFKLFKYLQY